MLTRSMKWCASRRNVPTTSRSSMNSPARRGGPSASLSRIRNSARQADYLHIRTCGEDMRAGDRGGTFSRGGRRGASGAVAQPQLDQHLGKVHLSIFLRNVALNFNGGKCRGRVYAAI